MNSIEENSKDNNTENISVNEFSELISKAQSYIKYIETQTDQLMKIKNKVLYSTNDEEKEISQNLNDIFSKVNNSRIKMDQIIKNLKYYLSSKNITDETDLRVQRNLFNSMLKKYQYIIQRFHDEENGIKKIKENKLVRSAEIVLDTEFNEKQRNELIQNPQYVQQIYVNKLKGNAHVKLQNALRDLEERHKDILKLQKSILELHKMIIELSMLVQYQGEMIDNIVENVNMAKDYITKGGIQINKAHERMKKPFYKI